LKRSPLKPKRETPRRNEGRVQHGRIKPKVTKTGEDRDHHDWIAGLGCLVCGAPATVHHVTSDRHQRIARSHHRVVPLCPVHHQVQHGPRESVEALGHDGFTARYGIDLLIWSDRAWALRDDPEHDFWVNGVTRLRKVALAMARQHDKGVK
jgi:hypothetical protein